MFIAECSVSVIPRLLQSTRSTGSDALVVAKLDRAKLQEVLKPLGRNARMRVVGDHCRASSFLADRLRDDRFLLKGADHDGKTSGYSV